MRRPDDLVRVVSDGAGGVIPSRTAAGRGAWLCRTGSGTADPACVTAALRRGGLGRALRTTVDPVRAGRELVVEHPAR